MTTDKFAIQVLRPFIEGNVHYQGGLFLHTATNRLRYFRTRKRAQKYVDELAVAEGTVRIIKIH